MWSAAVFEPALPGRCWITTASRPGGHDERAQRMKPNLSLNVAAACSFSSCGMGDTLEVWLMSKV